MKIVQLPTGTKTVLAGSAISSLSIWTGFFDAFTFPKFLLIVLLGICCLPLVFTYRNSLVQIRHYIFAVLLFITLFTVAVIAGDVIHTSLFGVQGRNMGFVSYFSIGVISLFFALIASTRVAELTMFTFRFVVGALVIYGCLQALNLDPLQWNLVYEGIIGNLGNPNFMSVMSGLAAAVFISGLIFESKKSALRILLHSGFLIMSISALIFSKSTQGWLVLAIALLPLIFIKLSALGKGIARAFLFSSLTLFSLLGAALFNFGPLARFVYQQSLEFRADFWVIAWKMAAANPWTGVGIDRYQNFYREYRTLEQVKRVGAEDFSDSAHNLYLHLAATGGFPLAISMLALNILVAYRFILALRSTAQSRELMSVIFGIWLGIQGQSLISVEYPSIALWSWILAGLGVGVSFKEGKANTPELSLGKKYGALLASAILSSISLIFLAPVASAQSSLLKGFYAYVEKGNQEAILVKDDFLKDMESKDPRNPTLPILSANSLFQDGAYKEAAEASKRAIAIDDHDYRSWWFLASSLESMDDREQAIPARLKTVELSPFNSQNLLELARNYQVAGDSSGLMQAQSKLREINSSSSEYLEAAKLTIP